VESWHPSDDGEQVEEQPFDGRDGDEGERAAQAINSDVRLPSAMAHLGLLRCTMGAKRFFTESLFLRRWHLM
jgi:hypothetical protein